MVVCHPKASNMKILQILPELNSGGVERGTVEFARELVKQGHESIVVSAGGRQVAQLEREGSRHIQMPVHKKSLSSLWQVRPLRQLFEAEQPDIVHMRSRVPAWLTVLAVKKMSQATRPFLVSTFHGMYSVNAYSAVMGKSDRVIAISAAVKDYILKNYPSVPESNIRMVHRGADPKQFPLGFQADEEWRAKMSACHPQIQGQKILLMPGRLSRWKGQLDFIDLIAQLRARGEAVCGLVAGSSDGAKQSYEEELRQSAIRQGVESSVIFLGHRTDMTELYSFADIVFNLSNRPEPFGRTVTEALSVGTPVVAYDQGGPGEVLRDCFPEGLSGRDNLPDVVLKVLASPSSIHFHDNYLLSTQVELTLAVYRELLAK